MSLLILLVDNVFHQLLDPNNTKLSKSQFIQFKCYINRETKVLVYPKYLVIETTNCCNLDCIMCPHGEMTRKKGFMNFELFKKIIDESEGKTEFIYLHFFGEPLLHPKIIDFINYAGGKGMTIALSTNATLLDENISKKILSSKLDLLIISIDSLNPDIYTKIRKGSKLETVIKNIDTLLKMQQTLESTLNISLQMIEMSLNKNEVETFNSHWKCREGLNLTIKPLYNYADQVKDINDLGKFPEKNILKKVCVEPWRGFVIGWDGIVVPCCNDFDYKFPLGDLREKTIIEVWNSERMKEMRICQKDGKQKSNDLCKGCLIHNEDYLTALSHISSFNPARKEAYAYFDKGLYAPEIYPEFENLWTEKYFEISVQDKFEDIKIIFYNDNPLEEKVGVNIFLFGKFIRDDIIYREKEIILKTPDEFKGRLLRYGFMLDKDWVPKDAGINDDTRRLGVRVGKIVN